MVKPGVLLNTLYSIVSTYVEFFFGLVISVLVARQLGPEQYGVYGYMMWLSTLLVTLVSGGVSLGAIKFIAEARADTSQQIASSVGLFGLINLYRYLQRLQFKRIFFFTLVGVIAVYVATRYQWVRFDSTMLYVVILASMLKAWHIFYVSVLKGFEDFRGMAVLACWISPLNLLLTLACYFTQQPVMVYIWAYFLVSATYLLISSILVRKDVSAYSKTPRALPMDNHNLSITGVKLTLFRHVRTASWIAFFSFIVLRQSELFFLNVYATADLMAYFNVGYTLAVAAMALVPGVYSTVLMPLMARTNKEEGNQVEWQLKLSLRYMLQLIIALLFPVCFFAKDIFLFLYGEQYLNAVLPFQVIIVSVALKTLSDCTNAYMWSKDQQSLMLKIILLGSLVTIGLDFYCIKHYSLLGALWAFSLSTLFFVLVNFGLAMRHFHMALDWWIYLKTIVSGAVATVFIAPIAYYLPNIYGVVVGGLASVFVYILLLLLSLSLRINDIDVLRTFNQRVFKWRLIESALLAIQRRSTVEEWV